MSPDLQQIGAHIRPDLPRLDVSPECSSADDLQQAWRRARRGAVAVGSRAQVPTLGYTKQDPADCTVVLRLGLVQRGIRWPLAGVE